MVFITATTSTKMHFIVSTHKIYNGQTKDQNRGSPDEGRPILSLLFTTFCYKCSAVCTVDI